MSEPRRRLDELRIAMMLLTRLPMGRVADPAPSIAQTRWAFPLVGLPVGLISWAGYAGASALGLTPLVAALLALGATALATGALHHDAIADFADGMGGGRDKDQVLEFMRDSRIGSYGVLALFLCIGLMATAMAQATPGLLSFVILAVFSRALMLAALTMMPPARDDGLGAMAEGAADWAMPLAAGLCFAGVVLGGVSALVALAVMALTATLLGAQAKRRIGGQTGDVLGAIQLSSETAGWLVFAALS